MSDVKIFTGLGQFATMLLTIFGSGKFYYSVTWGTNGNQFACHQLDSHHILTRVQEKSIHNIERGRYSIRLRSVALDVQHVLHKVWCSYTSLTFSKIHNKLVLQDSFWQFFERNTKLSESFIVGFVLSTWRVTTLATQNLNRKRAFSAKTHVPCYGSSWFARINKSPMRLLESLIWRSLAER